MNCASWNPVKLCKYKQYSCIINMKKKIEKMREKMNYYKKILLKSYLSWFHLDSNILAWIYENAKAKWRHYFQYDKFVKTLVYRCMYHLLVILTRSKLVLSVNLTFCQMFLHTYQSPYIQIYTLMYTRTTCEDRLVWTFYL